MWTVKFSCWRVDLCMYFCWSLKSVHLLIWNDKAMNANRMPRSKRLWLATSFTFLAFPPDVPYCDGLQSWCLASQAFNWCLCASRVPTNSTSLSFTFFYSLECYSVWHLLLFYIRCQKANKILNAVRHVLISNLSYCLFGHEMRRRKLTRL